MAVRPGVVHKAACAGEDRSDDRTGEGIYRAAGHRRRTVCAGAATRSDLPEATQRRHRGRDLRSLQARIDGRLCSAYHRRRCALGRGQGRQHRRNVRAGAAAERIERSVRAAAPGEWHREDDCGAQVAIVSANCSRMRAKPIVDRLPEKKFSTTVDYGGAVRTFSASGWSSICAMLLGFSYDVVNAVLAADADDVVDAVARAEAVKRCCTLAGVSSHRSGLQADAQHLAAGEEKRNRAGCRVPAFTGFCSRKKRTLQHSLSRLRQSRSTLRQRKEYQEALLLLSTARDQWTRFSTK